MSVLFITSKGKFVIDLFFDESPKEILNFLKLCQFNFYDLQVFYNIQKGFVVQSGNPRVSGNCEGTHKKDTSIWGLIQDKPMLVKSEGNFLKHDRKGLVSLVSSASSSGSSDSSYIIGSQFMITLGNARDLDNKGVVIGEIMEGLDELITLFDSTILGEGDDKRPLDEDIIILHTYVINDPFEDQDFGMPTLKQPTRAQTDGIRYWNEDAQMKKADPRSTDLASKALTLEILGDIDSSIQPSEKVLFICKLNPVTKESDLQIIFQRFGQVEAIEIIKDKQTGRSLNYGFIEFETKESCEAAYLKMDNALIDDRRIHVDFSQSISKEKKKQKLNFNMKKRPINGIDRGTPFAKSNKFKKSFPG